MASGPFTSWEIDGETVETVSDFIFRGSKITEDADCSHEIKRHLLLGRKAMTNIDNIYKSKNVSRKAQQMLNSRFLPSLLHMKFNRSKMTNLDGIFKSRDITLPTKVHLVKAMAFSCGHVWM